MSHEDLITIKALVIALSNLEQPLPKDLQGKLSKITTTLPESAYELIDLVESYEPLSKQYCHALQDLPREGERLKSPPTEASTDSERLLLEIRYQIALLKDLTLDETQIADEELLQLQSSPEAELIEQQWTETLENSEDILIQLAQEALEEFSKGETEPLNF